MSKYDQLIDQGREAKREKDSQQDEINRLSALIKQRYTKALKKELPDFYEALLKTNSWTKKKIYIPFLFFSIPKTIECLDMNYLFISKDGKLYQRHQKVFQYRVSTKDVQIDEDQFVEELYSRIDAQMFHTKQYLEQLLDSDIQEKAFKYFVQYLK